MGRTGCVESNDAPSTACCGITDPATCEADPAQGDELWTESAGPCWTVTADALFLHRSATRGPSLLVDPLGNVDPLKSSDLTFSTEAGPRLSVIRHGSCGWDFEVNYFGIDGWKSQTEFAAMMFNSDLKSRSCGWISRCRCP